MGITYEESDEHVYVIIIAPDGRVVTQRTAYRATGAITNWETSVSRRSLDYRTNEETAKLAVWAKFELECSNYENRLEHIASHYVKAVGRIIDVYIIRLSSGAALKCGRDLQLKLLPLEEVVKRVREYEYSFSMETIQAIEFFSKLGGIK